jgi:AmmeMemoRadiSam system protein B
MWYPTNKHELNKQLNNFLRTGKHKKAITGLIVPHAGYEYSGKIAGQAFSLIKKDSIKKAIIIGPSHYVHLFEAITSNREFWETPLGKIKTFNTDFPTGDIYQEHSIKNQIPFLQKLGIQEIMPLMIGKITQKQAEEIAKKIYKIKNTIYIFSTDLSHFLPYEQAVQTDKNSIKILEDLNQENFKYIDACGYFPLMILFHLCKLKKTKPKLIQYKNSGDITGDKTAVVGYSSFYF